MIEPVRDLWAASFKAAGWVFTVLTLAIGLVPSLSLTVGCGSAFFPGSTDDRCLVVRTTLDLPLILAGLAIVFFIVAHQLNTLTFTVDRGK